MSNETHLDDRELTAQHVAELENTNALINFFAWLGYDASDTRAMDALALGLDSEELRYAIRRIHKIGADPEDGEVEIYLFEVRSVTMALTQTARAALPAARRDVPADPDQRLRHA